MDFDEKLDILYAKQDFSYNELFRNFTVDTICNFFDENEDLHEGVLDWVSPAYDMLDHQSEIFKVSWILLRLPV